MSERFSKGDTIEQIPDAQGKVSFGYWKGTVIQISDEYGYLLSPYTGKRHFWLSFEKAKNYRLVPNAEPTKWHWTEIILAIAIILIIWSAFA